MSGCLCSRDVFGDMHAIIIEDPAFMEQPRWLGVDVARNLSLRLLVVQDVSWRDIYGDIKQALTNTALPW